jgi:homoserine dehydrogenase
MMDNNPDRKKADAFEHLVREPWMDMPLKSMTKAQREALREFDKKVQEVEDSLKKAVQIAEGERKVLEVEVIAVITEFNGQLLQLYHECIRYKMHIATAERARLALLSSVAEVRMFLCLPVSMCVPDCRARFAWQLLAASIRSFFAL